MSDNANKLGTDMSLIQNAYQGFAKQNYTMLDNLKLGYGGTRGEMERLLSDAEALSGVHYDIENLSDVYEAIHVIQTEMGITGTTMLEGSATVSGSIAQMNAAWQNFLTAVGDGGRSMDLSATVDALLESVGAMLSNAIPTIGRIAASLVLKLPDILMEALQGLPAMLQGAVTDAFGEDAGAMFAPITEAMENILSVVDMVWPTIQETISGVADVVMSVIEVAWPLISDIILTASQIIQGVAETVWPIVSGIIETAVDAIKLAIESLQPIVEFVTGIFDGIKTAMEDPVNAAKDAIDWAIKQIKGFFEFKIEWPHIPLPHFSISGSINPLDWFSQGLPQIGIEWYAKGGFVDGATLIGAGENGAEMILPKQGEMLEDFAEAITDEMHGGGDTFVFNITADSETTLQSLVAQAQRARIAYGRA
jgi:phage-related protein